MQKVLRDVVSMTQDSFSSSQLHESRHVNVSIIAYSI